MILKEYQKRALETVEMFLQRVTEWRGRQSKILEADPEADFDWVRRAWEKTTPARIYLGRRNGLGEPLPSFCLKIPTGGGKTLLATKIIDLVNVHYRRQPRGLVLWIVPTTQIYNQTLKALKDRGHPYRQQVDLASGGRTLVLEKTSGFKPSDVEENLCILLLMLPSANRETKAQLRMFRDSGGFDRFFPADDNAAGHQELLERTPNLDTFEQAGGLWAPQVKTSLGNALRLLRPLIVLDEGHKAYSRSAKATLEGFNPCMIVELSATPPRGANVLVEISGRELNAEEMIKLDLRINNRASTNWRDTLLASIDHRQRLEDEARSYEAATGVYIRPICLVQVERTGRDQRQPGVVHAEDVREYLLRHPRIGAEQIAVKTSQKDDLKELRAGLDDELLMPDPDREAARAAGAEDGEIDYAFAASHLLDVMPNPWRGHELIRRTFDALLEKHPREHVVGGYVFVLDELRKQLLRERDRLSRDVFETLLRDGTMRFIVVTDDLRFNRLPREIRQPPESKQANRTDGSPFLHNLFDRTAEDDLNELENRVATYLDQQERLFFWYRNRARKDYYVQGWKPGRIYADFIVTLRPDEPGAGDAFHQVFVIETKGIHLQQAADTAYKRSVFDICSQHARKVDWAEFVPAMNGIGMHFEIVDEEEWQQRLNALLAG